MANEVKISELPVATTIAGADDFPIVQGGITKQAGMNLVFDVLSPPTASGVVAMWPLDEVPDIPDSAAGTTYIQDEFLTTDSWVTYQGALSVANGALRCTVVTAGVNFRRVITTVNGKTWRLKLRGSKAETVSIKYYDGALKLLKSVALTTEWQIVDTYLASGSTNDTLYVEMDVAWAAGDWVEADWVYVGTGAYTTVVPDGSGHGIHGTMYGCTPGDDGLIGDGVNDYISMGNNGRITGALSLVIKVKRISTVAKAGLFGKYLTVGNQRSYLLDIFESSYPRFLVSGTGASAITVQHDVSLSDTEFETLICVFIPSTSITIYRGGVQVAQNTTSIPAALYDCTANLELFRSADHAVYANVEIGYAAIYDRALGTDEILGLSLGLRPSLPYRLINWQSEYMIDTSLTTSSFTVNTVSGYVLPQGKYEFTASSPLVQLQFLTASSWVGASYLSGQVCADGVNVRAYNPTASGVTVYYRKLDL